MSKAFSFSSAFALVAAVIQVFSSMRWAKAVWRFLTKAIMRCLLLSGKYFCT